LLTNREMLTDLTLVWYPAYLSSSVLY
jgi:hypothetical protein